MQKDKKKVKVEEQSQKVFLGAFRAGFGGRGGRDEGQSAYHNWLSGYDLETAMFGDE